VGTHLPVAGFYEDTLEVVVPHGIKADHMVTQILLLDTDKNIVVNKVLGEDEDPYLGVPVSQLQGHKELIPYAYCNIHGLWKGKPVKIPQMEIDPKAAIRGEDNTELNTAKAGTHDEL